MIVVNTQYKKQTIKTSIGKITMDVNGETEVSEEIGKRLINEHGFFEKGKKPKKVEEKKEIVTDLQAKERITELESSVLILNQRLEKSDSDLKLSRNETDSWKEEFTKLQSTLSKEVEKVDKKESLTITQLQENDINLVIDMWSKGMDELFDICKGLNLPEAEWKDKKKKDLVVFIAKKTLFGK